MTDVKDILEIDQNRENRDKSTNIINQCKGLSILLVLGIHCWLRSHAGVFFDTFFNVAVPFFYFLSGLGLSLKYRNKELDLKEFYRKKLLNLFFLYCFWVFVYNLIRYLIWYYWVKVDIDFVNYFIYNFLRLLVGNVPVLWFVYILIFYYLVFPFLIKIFKKLNLRENTYILLVTVFLTVILYLTEDDTILIQSRFIVEIHPDYIINIAAIFYVIPFFIYFLFGIYFAIYFEDFYEFIHRNDKKIMILSLFCFIIIPILILLLNIFKKDKDVFTYFTIKVLIYSILSIFFFIAIFIRYNNRFLIYNGKISSGIFYIHITIHLVIFYFFSRVLGINMAESKSLLLALLFFILLYLVCIICIFGIKKLPVKIAGTIR